MVSNLWVRYSVSVQWFRAHRRLHLRHRHHPEPVQHRKYINVGWNRHLGSVLMHPIPYIRIEQSTDVLKKDSEQLDFVQTWANDLDWWTGIRLVSLWYISGRKVL